MHTVRETESSPLALIDYIPPANQSRQMGKSWGVCMRTDKIPLEFPPHLRAA